MTWSKQSRQSRGYGRTWELARERVLARDFGLCQACKRKGQVRVGNEVHHTTPKAKGGTDDLSNLEVLCQACHEAADAEAQGKAVKTGCDLNGLPLDPNHAWNKVRGGENPAVVGQRTDRPRFEHESLTKIEAKNE